jgi:hypothetical protein
MTTNLCIIVYIVAVLITLITCFKSSLLVYNIISWEASTRHSFFLYFFIFFYFSDNGGYSTDHGPGPVVDRILNVRHASHTSTHTSLIFVCKSEVLDYTHEVPR